MNLYCPECGCKMKEGEWWDDFATCSNPTCNTKARTMEIAEAIDQCGVAVYKTFRGVGLYTWRLDEDGYPMNFIERLRLCWYVLVHGQPWTGEHVELEPEKARRLAQDIKDMTTEVVSRGH